MDFGETKWTRSTIKQVQRLTELVNQMLALTRMDEENGRGSDLICFSDAAEEAVETFLAPAKLRELTIASDIEPGICIRANDKNITQLFSILMDNAVKYATPGTQIELTLRAQGKRKAELALYNASDRLPIGDNSVLFERFYRADASRNSKTGGSGIGLSGQDFGDESGWEKSSDRGDPAHGETDVTLARDRLQNRVGYGTTV